MDEKKDRESAACGQKGANILVRQKLGIFFTALDKGLFGEKKLNRKLISHLTDYLSGKGDLPLEINL